MRWDITGEVCGCRSLSPSQLQGMLTMLQRDLGFGLTAAEVEMIEVVRDGLVERGKLGVDEQVMVARVLAIGTGRSDAHVLQTEIDRHLGWQDRAILEIGEIDLHPGRCRRGASGQRSSGRRALGHSHPMVCDITGRSMGNVVLVPHEQLKRVQAGFERDLGLGLAGTEMQMIEVVWNGLVERRKIRVHQQMMMTRILPVRARGRNPHVAEA